MLERRFIRERGLLRDRAYQGGGLSGRGLIREGPLSERGPIRDGTYLIEASSFRREACKKGGLIKAFLVRADHEHLR